MKDFALSKVNLEIYGLAQDGGNSIANAMELPQSCVKPLKWILHMKQCDPLYKV